MGSAQSLPACSQTDLVDSAKQTNLGRQFVEPGPDTSANAAATTTAQPIVPQSFPASKAKAQHPKAKGQVKASSKNMAVKANVEGKPKAKSTAQKPKAANPKAKKAAKSKAQTKGANSAVDLPDSDSD